MSYNFQYANEPQACTLAGAHYPTKPNTFTNCDFGIVASAKATRITLDALFNNFDNCITSIFALNVNGTTTANTLNINNNSITKTPLGGIGIRVENLRDATTAKIMNNNINIGVGYDPAIYGNKGIDVQNYLFNNVNLEVSNNTINNVTTAMHLRNVAAPVKCGTMAPNAVVNIHHNTLNISKPTADLNGELQTGMLTQNCNAINIYNNTITWQGNVPTASEVALVYGLNMENSFWCIVGENKTENMGSGIRMSGDCRFTKLYCNFMKQCYHGTNIDLALANTQVSDQGTTDESWNNKWEDINPGSPSHRVINNTQFPIIWYVDPNVGAEFTPCPATINCLPNVVLILNASGTIDGCIPPAIILDAALRYDEFGNTVNDSTYNDPDSTYFNYLDDEAYYRAGNRDSCMLELADTSDQAYLEYLAILEASNIGKFYEINSALLMHNLSEAAAKLQLLQHQNQIEEFKHFVLNYFLLYIADTLIPDVSLVEQLTQIAYTHPFYGGEAVYWARSILHLDVIDILPPLRKVRPLNAIGGILTKQNSVYKIFPNPTNDFVSIKSNNDIYHNIYANIFDGTGRLLLTKTLLEKDTKINLKDFCGGFYQIKIFEGDAIKQTEKLIIIK